jgi:hypothetical protein
MLDPIVWLHADEMPAVSDAKKRRGHCRREQDCETKNRDPMKWPSWGVEPTLKQHACQ